MSKRQGKQMGILPDPQTLAEVYQLLLHQVTDGIFITNQEGYLLEVNPQGCQITGYTYEELRQLSWQDLLAAESSTQALPSQVNLAINQAINSEGHLWRKDNQLILVNINAHKLNNGHILWIVHDLSVSQHPGTTLRERIKYDKQLAKIVATAPGILCLFQLQPDGTATCPYASPDIQEIYDLTPEELAKDASPVLSLIHPDDVAHVQESIADSARTQLPWQEEYRVQHPVKGDIWVEGRSTLELKPDGTVLWYGFLQDTTERKKAEEALQTNQARITGIIESAMDAIISIDAGQRIILFNEAAEQMFGCPAAAALGQPLDLFIPERFRQGHQAHIQTFAQTGVTNRGMGTLGVIFGQRLNGEEFPIEASISQIEAAGTKLFTVILRDVTERHEAEEALRRSEARFRNYFELGLVGQAIISPRRVFLEFNDQMCSILGYERNELLHMNWSDLTHPDDVALEIIYFNQVIAGEIDGYSLEKRFIAKDGQAIHSNISVKCIRNADGTVNYFVALLQNITQRKKAEEQLLYQANLLQNVSDAIVATDMYFKITSWNRAAETMYGWSTAEAFGRGVNEILSTVFVEDETDHVLQQFLEEGIWQGEVAQKHKDGSTLNVLSSVSMIKDSNNNVIGIVAVNRDITERKEAEKAQALLEAQLQQAQKMESIGQLAGGVAHDFNNMLTVIQMYSELIRSRLPVDHPLIEKIELIRSASQRSTALTRQLLAFSRQQMLTPQVIDLNGLVKDLLKMVERLIGEDIILSSVYQPGLWSITADPGQIEQVIMNLVVNARDAMPRGGMLTIETRNIQLDETYARLHFGVSPGPFILLTITDTGQGMDKQTLSRIFEPFFTTKEQGKGTGLGLATVHGIVKQSGGNILVYSELDKGTTFKVYLPANIDESSYRDQPQVQAASLGGSEVILLVEDEEMVRELVQDALDDLGYTVLVAHNGDTALSLAKEYPAEIDLLLTDVIMPRMSGRQVAEQLQLLRPQTKVLFMSGYTDDAAIRHGLLMAEVEFLHKPFTPADLAGKVRQVLDKKVGKK